MKFFPPLGEGILVRRYKRFLADVRVGGEIFCIHCPNTGAMTGCADPGNRVWFSRSDNPKRKYPHTWELSRRADGAMIGVNTARANALICEALEGGVIPELADYPQLRAEVTYPQAVQGSEGRSRADFLLSGRGECYLEVKSLTLEVGDGVGLFPDARSTRAIKHLEALAAVVAGGGRAALVFCVQHSEVTQVRPADAIDPEYGTAIRAAAETGVELYAVAMALSPEAIRPVGLLPVVLP